MPVTDAEVLLPALSLTLAAAPRLSPSPVTVLSDGHAPAPAMPESLSPHVQLTVTLPLYQPSAFGCVVAAPDRLGAVSSTLMSSTVVEALLPAASVAVPL